jgi:hypothetical protein
MTPAVRAQCPQIVVEGGAIAVARSAPWHLTKAVSTSIVAPRDIAKVTLALPVGAAPCHLALDLHTTSRPPSPPELQRLGLPHPAHSATARRTMRVDIHAGLHRRKGQCYGQELETVPKMHPQFPIAASLGHAEHS